MAPDPVRTLARGNVDLIPQGELERKLAEGRPLRVKLGVDPSRPDLTLGHAVVLRTLRRFQDAGHVAVLIVGDFTARIGDPSGRSETRPMLTEDEIGANAETYLAQAGKVIDVGSAELRRNSEWLSGLDMAEVIRLTSTATVAQMLDRDDFRDRYRDGRAISVVEFLYPLLQGFDSVAVRADVEVGGTDQTFNLLMGREVQQAYGQEPQVVLTVPLLEGTDGVRKMSKSLDNYIALTEPPDDMFGKLMRIPDHLIPKFLRLTTDTLDPEIEEIEVRMNDGTLDPNAAKRSLARTVVDLYHGPGAGHEAEGAFDRLHRLRVIPDEGIPSVVVDRSKVMKGEQVDVGALLHELGLASSRSDGRRLVEQLAVRCRLPGDPDETGKRVTTGLVPWRRGSGAEWEGSIWSVGKRKFARLQGFSGA